MNIEKVNVTLDIPNRSSCKRVTVYMDKAHKRFLEDIAHKHRITEFEVLYHILDDAMLKRQYEQVL